mgnify:CR=1 FL=1
MVKEKVGNLAWLRKQLETEDKDLLRELVKAVVEELMSADADAVCGAVYRQASPQSTCSSCTQRRSWRRLECAS